MRTRPPSPASAAERDPLLGGEGLGDAIGEAEPQVGPGGEPPRGGVGLEGDRGRGIAVVLVAQLEAEEGREAHQASARAAARGARITSVSAVSAPASIVTVRMR